MGDSDVDTFANITRADYDFDDEAFDTVTQNAKDFISNLLVHRKEDRLSAKQCLESTWFTQQNDDSSSKIRICTDKLKKFIIRRKWQVCMNKLHMFSFHPSLLHTPRFDEFSQMFRVLNSYRTKLSMSLYKLPWI